MKAACHKLTARETIFFAVNIIDSVGPPGRLVLEKSELRMPIMKLTINDDVYRRSRGILWATLREELIVASLRHKSSKGAPVLLDSFNDTISG